MPSSRQRATGREPSRDEISQLVINAVANLAGVAPSSLNESTRIDEIFPEREVADRYLAESLRGVVLYRGGETVYTRDLRQALTIRDLIEEILKRWR